MVSEKRKLVLVADDEADVLEYVQTVLEDCGCELRTARDGEAALAALRTDKPDLVILDVQMPKKNGFEVFGAMKKDKATAAIPVIMLTAITARTDIKFDGKTMLEFYGAEPEKYIDKPIAPEALREAVSEILG